MRGPLIMQVVGYKNSGKTTLISELIRRLSEQKVRIGTVKHDAHGFIADREGSDSWQHQEAGALYTAITSPYGTATFEKRGLTLDELIERMVRDTAISSDGPLDLILVEGFKTASYPKIVLLRNEGDVHLLEQLTNVAAICLRFSPANLPNDNVASRLFADLNADTNVDINADTITDTITDTNKDTNIDTIIDTNAKFFAFRSFTNNNNGSGTKVLLFSADEHEAIAQWLGRLVTKHRRGEVFP